MIQEDWLMSQFARFAQVFARILGLRASDGDEAALLEVDAASRRIWGGGTDLALRLTLRDLLQMLKRPDGQGLDVARAAALARLLGVEASLRAGGGADVAAWDVRALELWAAVLDGRRRLQDDWLQDAVASGDRIGREATGDARRGRWRILELAGRYADAEDELGAMRDAGEAGEDEERAFYERLRALPADVLEAGGLSPDDLS